MRAPLTVASTDTGTAVSSVVKRAQGPGTRTGAQGMRKPGLPSPVPLLGVASLGRDPTLTASPFLTAWQLVSPMLLEDHRGWHPWGSV